MKYPEELRERYNEVMYDERDIIEKFLKDQYDIRYGRQRDTWHFEPAIEMIAHQGSHVLLHDIKLDKDRFVVFYVEAFCNKNAEWECSDFAYGELSKVIEALPDADEIVRKNAINDISWQIKNLGIDQLLQESPFNYEVGGNVYNVYNYKMSGDEIRLLSNDGGVFIPDGVPLEMITAFRDHINIEVLHRSNEYKELMELLSLEENLRFECQNCGDATFVIDGTDVTFDVSSVSRNDNGCLVIRGNDIDADVCDKIELTEKDIKHEYLVGIINKIKESNYDDIMDTYNAHNPELVRKINAAWKNKKYHERFGAILLALLTRDKEEFENRFDCDVELTEVFAYTNANEIMEGVCDDWDLETILSFIRYEE